MICAFCSKHVDTEKEALEAKWIRYFWAGDKEYEGPVCRKCAKENLRIDKDEEAYLCDDEKLPPLAIPFSRYPTNYKKKRNSDLG